MSAANRTEQMSRAQRMLVEAVQRLSATENWQTFLEVARRLPDYSPNNCLLLAVQGAQGMVMGYHAWRRVPSVDGGYCQVRRGASGLSILAPVLRRVEEELPDGGTQVVRRPSFFRRTTVFDEQALVAPPDLPHVEPPLLEGHAPERLEEALSAEIAAAGYGLLDAAFLDGGPNGLTSFRDQTVFVRRDLSPAQRVKTLAHELVHVRMHDPGMPRRPDRVDVAEVEAESAAYLVVGTYGLDSSDYSLPYLAAWAEGDHELVLATARNTIAAAREITEALERHLELPAPTVTEVLPARPAGIEPPAPVPLADAGETGMVMYSMPVGVEPLRVRIGTPAGRWEIGWDPPLGTFYGQHHTYADGATTDLGGLRPEDGPTYWIGASPEALPSVGRLEEQLGFALPWSVHEFLESRWVARPPHTSGVWRFLTDAEPKGLPGREMCPGLGAVVEVPGRAPTTYLAAMRAAPPIRTWTQDGYRLDVLATRPFRESGELRQMVTHRLSHQDAVVFSGQNFSTAGHVDVRSDDSVYALVDLICSSDPQGFTDRQAAFVREHGAALIDLVTAPSPPYEPGTRIAIGGRTEFSGMTGTVVSHQVGLGAEIVAYSWRPDRADLPGHPWRDDYSHTLVSPAEDVRPTLAARDVGLEGWEPSVPLAFGAEVNYVTSANRDGAGVVQRVFPALGGGLAYEIGPTGSDEPPRVPADLVEPTAGTAWRSFEDLVAAREMVHLPLVPGEVLAAGGAVTHVVDGLNGPELAAEPPTPYTAPPDLGL